MAKLISAVNNGNLSTIKELLKDPKIDVNESNTYGTAFFQAVTECDNLDIIRLFLDEERVDVNQQGEQGRTSLNSLCKMDDYFPSNAIAILGLLIEHPRVDINMPDNRGNTPLHNAVRTGKLEFVKILLESQRININKENNGGQTLLQASINKYIDSSIFNLLYSDPRISIKIDYNVETLLEDAIDMGCPEVVKILLADVRINETNSFRIGNTLLSSAIRSSNIDTTKLLLADERIDVNEINSENAFSHLYTAVDLGLTEIVELLLTVQNIDIHQNEPFLNIAVKNRQIKLIKVLLQDQRIDVNSTDNYGMPLHYAILYGNETIVSLLLADKRTNVNSLSKLNRTPLAASILEGSENILKLLLADSRIDVNMHCAETRILSIPITQSLGKSFDKYFPIFKTLMEDRRIDVNQRDKNGKTTLFHAVITNNLVAVELLVNDSRTDRNIPNYDNLSPLEIACREEYIEIVKLLLSNPSPISSDDIGVFKKLPTEIFDIIGSFYFAFSVMNLKLVERVLMKMRTFHQSPLSERITIILRDFLAQNRQFRHI